MNVEGAVWVVVFVTLGMLAITAGAGLIVVKERLSKRVRRELEHGNMQVRWRLRSDLGRRYEAIRCVRRAETMRGWVWIAMERHPPDPYLEQSGWALTKRSAERAMRNRSRQKQPV